MATREQLRAWETYLPNRLFAAVFRHDSEWVDKGAYRPHDKLGKHGFPLGVTKALLKTANDTNSVVMSRAPGEAASGLIEEGHDLKGYQIKAKSCNWGPMAGFLCQLPPLNKAGSAKIGYNGKNYKKYLDYRTTNGMGPKAFIPLKITASRWEFLRRSSFMTAECFKILGDEVVGIAFSSDKSVAVEFLLKKAGELWEVFHGNVFFRESETDAYQDYLRTRKMPVLKAQIKKSLPKGVTNTQETNVMKAITGQKPTPKVTLSAAASSALKTIRDKQKLPGFAACEKFFALQVAQNPFPPYDKQGDRDSSYDPALTYKNAVTGDYDLFAVWPRKPPVGWEMLVRLADVGKRLGIAAGKELETPLTVEQLAARGQEARKLFLRVPAKPFALELTASENVFVEVIPGFDEIAQWEGEERGNINPGVAWVAQALNDNCLIQAESRLIGGKKLGRHFPNAAFHSDEGGRPGIDEVDYPFAVFLPDELYRELKREAEGIKSKDVTAPTSRVLLIDNHVDFLALALMLRGKTYVLFNHVWLATILSMLLTPEQWKALGTDATKDGKEFLDKQSAEQEKAKGETAKLEKIASAAIRLLIKSHIATDAGVKAANDPLRKLAETFASFVSKKWESADTMVDELEKQTVSDLK